MRKVLLPNTDIEASRLGFGCVSLTSGNDPRRAKRLLQVAFDHGVTHYDTARAYGMGHSETILGEFIRDKRDKVTVTTKLGIQPYSPAFNARALLRAAKAVLRRFPILEEKAKKHAQGRSKSSAFHPTEAAKSLAQSLRALRTDYVDILLLHECTVDEARNEAIIEFLKSEVDRGTVRYVGIGSDRRKLRNDLHSFPKQYTLFQFENNPLLPSLDNIAGTRDRAIITHSALHPLKRLSSDPESHKAMVKNHSDIVGADLGDAATVSRLLLEYALAANPHGVILFATTQEANLTTNLRAADRRFSNEQLDNFVSFVRETVASSGSHDAVQAVSDVP